MRIALVYPEESRKLQSIAAGLQSVFQDAGHSVQQMAVGSNTGGSSLYACDLAVVGSSISGFLGGKFSPIIAAFLQKSTGLERKKVAVFVSPHVFSVTKGTRRLMQALEQRGAFVFDFRTIRSTHEAQEFGKKILAAAARK